MNNFKKYRNVNSILINKTEDINVKPDLSILIPTYNRPRELSNAIKSCFVKDNNLNIEILVVDNSQDLDVIKEVNAVVSSFKVNFINLYRNEKNIGMFGNWNRCVELAKADKITILNDDDCLSDQIFSVIHTSKQCSKIHFGNVDFLGSSNSDDTKRARNFRVKKKEI